MIVVLCSCTRALLHISDPPFLDCPTGPLKKLKNSSKSVADENKVMGEMYAPPINNPATLPNYVAITDWRRLR